MKRHSLLRLIKYAWKHSWEPVYPSDAWNPLHRLFWGFPIVLLVVILRCRKIRKVMKNA